MKFLGAAALLFALEASALPQVIETLEKRSAVSKGCKTSKKCDSPPYVSNKMAGIPSTPNALQKASAARDNCGALNPCTLFDAEEQLVSVTGQYAYASPASSQIRGPCPGLNAAANHGYLPRSGVASITQTITGLGGMYGMSTDLAGFLAAYAVAIDGDLVSMTWSIGGPQGTFGAPVLLGNGQGISYSHNKYEGDSSIGRCDAYINGGDAHSLSVQRFANAYAAGQPSDRYTFDKFAQEFTKNTYRSVMQNPYYFTGLFSTTLVSPAAYNFVIAFMSNHTEKEVGGYLDSSIFKEFFGVSGSKPSEFKWNKGQERAPTNWYRRPRSQPYTASGGVFGDLGVQFLAYPNSFRFGGNTGKVNTYTGVNLTSFTGGAYNADTLFKGNNLACFAYEGIQQAVPDFLSTGALNAAQKLLAPYLSDVFGALNCPSVAKFNDNDLEKYPGRNYNPTGKATNC